MRSAIALVIAGLLLVPAGASAKTLVHYERSNFRAPVVAVTVDGSRAAKAVKGDDARGWKLSKKRFRALKRALADAHWAGLEGSYENERIADGPLERVTYRGKTVSVRGGSNPPARLQKVLDRLSALAA